MEYGNKARVLLGTLAISAIGGLGYEWEQQMAKVIKAGGQIESRQAAEGIQRMVNTIENPANLTTSFEKDFDVDNIASDSQKLSRNGPQYVDSATWNATKTALDKIANPGGGILDDVQLQVIGNSRRELKEAGFKLE